jgi:hypothetical protein
MHLAGLAPHHLSHRLFWSSNDAGHRLDLYVPPVSGTIR